MNSSPADWNKKYAEYKKSGAFSDRCNLCEKAPPIKEFKYWKIAENIFPWDKIAKSQDMIIPKRHVRYEELTKEEKEEYEEIKKDYIETKYDVIAEATDRIKSIPAHFHIHLIITKD